MQTRATGASFLIAAAAAITPAHAQQPFYAGKTVTLVVSAGSGGGYTAYARLLSRHMGKHIPGNPTITLQYRQGAGGIVASNYLYNTAPRDGTVIAAIHRGALSSVPLYGGEGIKYKPTEFTWIGSLNNEVSYCVSWHTAPVRSFADLKTKELIVGGVGDGSETDFYPNILNNVVDAKVKLIAGYKGGEEIVLAMERGEVQGRCAWSLGSMRSSRPQWLKEGKLNFLVQFALEKNPSIDAPLLIDLAKTPDERAMLELIVTPQVLGRAYLGPPQIPAERTKELRQAFDRMLTDEEFIAEAKKQGLDIDVVDGPTIEKLINKMFATPPAVVARAAEVMKRKNN